MSGAYAEQNETINLDKVSVTGKRVDDTFSYQTVSHEFKKWLI